MRAVIGLGNPGAKYESTRHNVGFWVVSKIASGEWREKFGSLFQKGSVGGDESLLVLPQRFMNRSGEAAVPLLRFFKIEVQDVVVIHDELDFDPGVVRVRRGGSSGGHNGVADLIQHLGSPNFIRVRVGIGHPRRAGSEQEVASWVLSPPRKEELAALNRGVERAGEAVRLIFEKGLEGAQQLINTASA